MSESGEHDECRRRERELEALVSGQANEIVRLGNELDATEGLLLHANDAVKGSNGYAELQADEALRRASEHIQEARGIIRKHTRRKAFTTGLGLPGLDD